MDPCDQKLFKFFRCKGDGLFVFFRYLAEDLFLCAFVTSETKKEDLVKKSPAFQFPVPGHPLCDIISQDQYRFFLPVKHLSVENTLQNLIR